VRKSGQGGEKEQSDCGASQSAAGALSGHSRSHAAPATTPAVTQVGTSLTHTDWPVDASDVRSHSLSHTSGSSSAAQRQQHRQSSCVSDVGGLPSTPNAGSGAQALVAGAWCWGTARHCRVAGEQ